MNHIAPVCPACAQPMTLTRVVPDAGSRFDLNVFDCAGCRVNYVTEDYEAINPPPSVP